MQRHLFLYKKNRSILKHNLLWIKTKTGLGSGICHRLKKSQNLQLLQISFAKSSNFLYLAVSCNKEKIQILAAFFFSTSVGLQHLGPSSFMTRMLLFWNQNWFIILVLSSFIFPLTSCLFCSLSCSLTPLLSSKLFVVVRSLAKLMSLLGLCLVFTVSGSLNSLQSSVFLASLPFNVERIWSLLFAALRSLVASYWWKRLSGMVA